jgi:hypothetical protein
MCIKKGTTLQAGAFTALRLPEIWSALLEMYTNKLKEDRTDGISEAYNKALQEEIDEYQEEQYREWLNGDRSNYAGVVKEIARYFTESRQGEYDREEREYTFTLDEQDIENMTDDGYKPSQGKKYLLDAIATASNARRSKDQIAREVRKLERERLKAYKAEQARQAEAERKAKLLSMTIN